MNKKRRALIISIVLFIISAGFIFTAFVVPKIGNADLLTRDNTFMHQATIKYVEKHNNAFEIHIQENTQILGIGMTYLDDKMELLDEIKQGDTITFWTYYSDTFNLPDVEMVPICAFSINDVPVVTIEESNLEHQKSMIILRTFVIVIAVILIFIGVFLLLRAYRKPKDKINQNT